MILRSNLVIDKAAAWSPPLQADQDLKKQYVAEARFMRGFALFHVGKFVGKSAVEITI